MAPGIRRYCGLAISLTALTALVAINEPARVWGTILDLDAWNAALLVLVCPVAGVGLAAVRFRAILAAAPEPAVWPSAGQQFALQVHTSLVNNLAFPPAAEVFRAAVLRKWGLSLEACVSTQVFEKLIEVIGIGLLCGLVVADPDIPATFRTPAAFLLVASAVFLGLLAAGLAVRDRFRWEMLPARWRALVHRKFQTLQACWRPGVFVPALAATLCADAGNALTILLATEAVGAPVAFGPCVIVLVAVRLAGLVPAAPGQVGVLEVGIVSTLAALGLGGDKALAVALLYRFAQILAVAGAAGAVAAAQMISQPVRP